MKSIFLFLIILLQLSVTTATGQKSSKKLLITGTVLDSNLKPVSGAMILIDNQRTNITTNRKGSYKIKVDPEARTIAVFTSGNGMDQVEIAGKTKINFSLKTAVSSSNSATKSPSDEETVNIGYGTVKRKDLTTQVNKIDATKRRYAAYQNIYDMIRGEIPGVQVNGKSIMIQGPTSFISSTEPLFVVDGIVVSTIDYISPVTVKSIEVLKGSAASIYGSRGSNGVILINLIGSGDNR